MKKKYCILTIALIIVCIILPIAIERLYILGETHPLIFTTYSASDILGYIATVIGLVISVVAIFLSLQTNEIQLSIKHAFTLNDNNKESLVIQICNNSVFDCNIDSVEICNKKQRRYAHIVSTPPFSISAKGHKDFVVEIDRIEKILNSLKLSKDKSKAKYCIRLSLNKTIYLNTNELIKNLDIVTEHNKKYGIGVK